MFLSFSMKRGPDFSRPDGMIFRRKGPRGAGVPGRWRSGARARTCGGMSRGRCDDGAVPLDTLSSATGAPKSTKPGALYQRRISLKTNRSAREPRFGWCGTRWSRSGSFSMQNHCARVRNDVLRWRRRGLERQQSTAFDSMITPARPEARGVSMNDLRRWAAPGGTMIGSSRGRATHFTPQT